MARPQQSLLQRLVGRTATHLARWLLTPRLRQAARVRDQLVESLAEVVQPSIQGSPVAVAIVEAAMALSLADGSFGQEEWELYSQCLERLNLSDQQRQDISLHGSPDLVRISASLAGLEDPSHRLAIAQTFCLFAAADGQVAGSEIGFSRPCSLPWAIPSWRMISQDFAAAIANLKPGGNANAPGLESGFCAGLPPIAAFSATHG